MSPPPSGGQGLSAAGGYLVEEAPRKARGDLGSVAVQQPVGGSLRKAVCSGWIRIQSRDMRERVELAVQFELGSQPTAAGQHSIAILQHCGRQACCERRTAVTSPRLGEPQVAPSICCAGATSEALLQRRDGGAVHPAAVYGLRGGWGEREREAALSRVRVCEGEHRQGKRQHRARTQQRGGHESDSHESGRPQRVVHMHQGDARAQHHVGGDGELAVGPARARGPRRWWRRAAGIQPVPCGDDAPKQRVQERAVDPGLPRRHPLHQRGQHQHHVQQQQYLGEGHPGPRLGRLSVGGIRKRLQLPDGPQCRRRAHGVAQRHPPARPRGAAHAVLHQSPAGKGLRRHIGRPPCGCAAPASLTALMAPNIPNSITWTGASCALRRHQGLRFCRGRGRGRGPHHTIATATQVNSCAETEKWLPRSTSTYASSNTSVPPAAQYSTDQRTMRNQVRATEASAPARTQPSPAARMVAHMAGMRMAKYDSTAGLTAASNHAMTTLHKPPAALRNRCRVREPGDCGN